MRTKDFDVILSNGTRTTVTCRWDSDARWYVGRVGTESVYVERDGTQV
jgi:hypothetical protein